MVLEEGWGEVRKGVVEGERRGASLSWGEGL